MFTGFPPRKPHGKRLRQKSLFGTTFALIPPDGNFEGRGFMFRKFKFEEGVYEKLQTIPLSTQFKLDRIGISISQNSWIHFSPEERLVLCHLSVRSQGEQDCYRDYLTYLLRHNREPVTPMEQQVVLGEKSQWEGLARVPESVYLRALGLKAMITPADWIRLDDLERYALFKLSGDSPSVHSFEKALQEFLGQTIIKPPKWADAS